MRGIVLECGLTEERKWGVPCYTLDNTNILIISAFKEFFAISFFKGSLMKDPNGMLESPGANSQAARLIKFTQTEKVVEMETVLKSYIKEAIEVEKAGLKVKFKKASEYEIPEEMQRKFDEDPAFKNAFYDLTPGRQKGYLLYFSSAKQSKTREARIEKYSQRIFNGKGLHD